MHLPRWHITLLATGAMLSAGCQSPCEAAFEQTETKFRDCGLVIEPPAEADDACDGDLRDLLSCEAACAESAPCDALDGTNAAASIDFASCLSRCQPVQRSGS